jgi:hypothetical protein
MFKFLRTYKIIAFLYIGMFNQTAVAQNTLSTSSILATAKTQTAIVLQERKISVLTAQSYKLPFFEKADFQTETDRFDLQRQEYRLRTSFNGWAEMRSLKQQKEANIQKEQAEHTVLFKDVLYDRYALIVENQMEYKALLMYRQLLTVYADKRDVFQKMAKLTTDFNIEDLIRAEEAAFDYQQKILQSEGTIRNINQFLKRTFNKSDSFQLDTTDWIPLSKIRLLVSELPTTAEKNPVLAYQQAAIGAVQSEYNLEKSQTKKIIDYAQIRNSARNKDGLVRDWSVGLGITIPYNGSSKIKLNEIAFKRLEAENKLKNLQTNYDLDIFNLQQDLDLIFKEYDFVEKQVNESQTLYALDHYANIQGSSPIVLLRMKELVLKRQEQLISLERTAYQKYIKWLDLTGKLSETPLKNYLSVDLSTF